ncbi:MAG: redoxin domain-containing protein [Amphritea sp.]
MKRWLLLGIWALLGCTITAQTVVAADGRLDTPLPAPEFTQNDEQAWLNSRPLTLADLQGKVVLLDFWTFDCWNCYRSFPWLKELEHKLADSSFQVVSIHTPEFAHERLRGNLEAKIEQFELDHPVMMDNDFGYWKAMGNRYWPAFYILDKQGQVRSLYVGETHSDSQQARVIEKDIRALLEEPY